MGGGCFWGIDHRVDVDLIMWKKNLKREYWVNIVVFFFTVEMQSRDQSGNHGDGLMTSITGLLTKLGGSRGSIRTKAAHRNWTVSPFH